LSRRLSTCAGARTECPRHESGKMPELRSSTRRFEVEDFAKNLLAPGLKMKSAVGAKHSPRAPKAIKLVCFRVGAENPA